MKTTQFVMVPLAGGVEVELPDETVQRLLKDGYVVDAFEDVNASQARASAVKMPEQSMKDWGVES